MKKFSRNYSNDVKACDFIKECETSFTSRLTEVSETLIKDGTKIIALSGPTCSGKTTTAAKLTKELTAAGADVHLVSIDNFFRTREFLNREALMANTNIDYDSVSAIDLELLRERAASIIRGEQTELPVYDFTLGKAVSTETVCPGEHSVFIFEGIQAIYPEVTALFGDDYKSVYISVDDDLWVDDEFFSKRELRLFRRLVRDFKYRGASPEFTFFLWRSVAKNEDTSILPYADTADIKINSFMGYEIYLMRSVLPEILSQVPESSQYFPKAYEILKRLAPIEALCADLVPETSVLREFI